MFTIKPSLFAILTLLVCGIVVPGISTKSAFAFQRVPKGQYRLTGVQVSPINRTRTADGKVKDAKSDTLTHSLRFDTRAAAELIDGTKDMRFEMLNPTVEMSMTVDKPIKFKGEVVPAGTNLLAYKEFNGRKFSIRMRPLNPLAAGSIRLTNDFVFPPDSYKIKFAWTTSEGEVISQEVPVVMAIIPDAPEQKKKKPAGKKKLDQKQKQK